MLGMMILALGLTLNAQTGLGVSPITSVPYTVSRILPVSFGNATFISYLIFVAIQLLLSKKPNRLAILLQIPVSLLFTRVMNVYGAVIDIRFSSLTANLLLLLVAIALTGIGAAMTLCTKIVPNPADGIVQELSRFFYGKLGLTKNIFDLLNALVSLCLGWAVGVPLLGVGIGTIFCVFGVGRVIAVFNRYLKAFIQKQSGLEEAKREETPAVFPENLLREPTMLNDEL